MDTRHHIEGVGLSRHLGFTTSKVVYVSMEIYARMPWADYPVYFFEKYTTNIISRINHTEENF